MWQADVFWGRRWQSAPREIPVLPESGMGDWKGKERMEKLRRKK